MRSQGVSERTRDEQWKRRQRKQRERCIQIKHHGHYDHNLQQRDHALLDSVNQHALDRVHILNHPRHQIARGPIVEPTKRQQLNMRIQIAPQIEDYFLLERIVQHNPHRIESMLKQKRRRRQ